MTTDTTKHSQCQSLLSHLKAGKTITQIEALDLYGILRLASRVNDLRKRGHAISTEMVPVFNRNGQRCVVARYQMDKNTKWL